MKSRFRLLKHPLHPMLVMFPVAIFPLLLLLDVVQWWQGAEQLWDAAFWLTLAGLATTLVAIVPGVVDLNAIRDGTRPHRVGLVHAVVGTFVLLLFAAATWLRWAWGPEQLAFLLGLDVLGSLAVGVQGWLGGELVYKHHVGVDAPEEGGEPALPERHGPAGPTTARRDLPR